VASNQRGSTRTDTSMRRTTRRRVESPARASEGPSVLCTVQRPLVRVPRIGAQLAASCLWPAMALAYQAAEAVGTPVRKYTLSLRIGEAGLARSRRTRPHDSAARSGWRLLLRVQRGWLSSPKKWFKSPSSMRSLKCSLKPLSGPIESSNPDTKHVSVTPAVADWSVISSAG
jgi:hypothetical protein